MNSPDVTFDELVRLWSCVPLAAEVSAACDVRALERPVAPSFSDLLIGVMHLIEAALSANFGNENQCLARAEQWLGEAVRNELADQFQAGVPDAIEKTVIVLRDGCIAQLQHSWREYLLMCHCSGFNRRCELVQQWLARQDPQVVKEIEAWELVDAIPRMLDAETEVDALVSKFRRSETQR